MLVRPEVPQVPEKFPAWYIAGHALRAVAYGFGAFQLAHLGYIDISKDVGTYGFGVHNFGAQVMQGIEDGAMFGSALYLAGGAYKNTKNTIKDIYYNASGMGRRVNQALRDKYNPTQIV